MAYQFEFDSVNLILRCRFSGHITSQFMEKFYADARQHDARFAPRITVFDFTDVTSSDVASSSVRNLAESPPVVADPARPRIVVAPAPLIFGMARMFQIRGESTRPGLEVVRSLDQAWARFGLQDPHFEPIEPQ